MFCPKGGGGPFPKEEGSKKKAADLSADVVLPRNIRGMAAPAVQIAAALMPQHISDRVPMFILTDLLAAQAAAQLSKAWHKCILSNFCGPL